MTRLIAIVLLSGCCGHAALEQRVAAIERQAVVLEQGQSLLRWSVTDTIRWSVTDKRGCSLFVTAEDCAWLSIDSAIKDAVLATDNCLE